MIANVFVPPSRAHTCELSPNSELFPTTLITPTHTWQWTVKQRTGKKFPTAFRANAFVRVCERFSPHSNKKVRTRLRPSPSSSLLAAPRERASLLPLQCADSHAIAPTRRGGRRHTVCGHALFKVCALHWSRLRMRHACTRACEIQVPSWQLFLLQLDAVLFVFSCDARLPSS